MNRLQLLSILLALLISSTVQAQKTVLPEIGMSYITNDIDVPNTRLYDFLALTLNPRVLLVQGDNYSFSFDVPLSLRSRTKDDRTTRLGLLIPALGMINYGAGAASTPNRNAVGFTAGLGWAYFHQRTQAEVTETPQYKESLSSTGPMIQAGVRIPNRKVTLFRYKDSRAYTVTNIKFSYLVNLGNSQKNIGALSVLLGLGF